MVTVKEEEDAAEDKDTAKSQVGLTVCSEMTNNTYKLHTKEYTCSLNNNSFSVCDTFLLP